MAGGKKISELSVDSELSGDELVPLVDGTTKRTTTGAIAALAEADPVYAFQGQRPMGEAEAIGSGSFVIAHEIPVTIREGKLYTINWLLGLTAETNVAQRIAAVRFYLAAAEGSWDGALQVTAYWERLYPAGFTIRDVASGAFPLITTGSSTPIVPGSYWLRMIAEEQSTTGTLVLYDFHPPMLQLAESDPPP